MGTHRFTVATSLSPTEAHELWTDLDRLPLWMAGVASVHDVMPPPGRAPFILPRHQHPLVVAPGSRYTLHFRSGSVRHEVLWLEDRSRTAFRTRQDGSVRRGETLVTFEPVPGGSLVTLDVRAEGLLPSIAARAMAIGTYPGSFRGNLAAFARLAERERWSRMVL